MVLMRPCSLPATLLTLGLRRQGSIIVPPACYRPQAATLALRHGVGRSTFPVGESIMAHPPPGSIQTECVRLPYAAPPLSCVAFFIKVQPCGLRVSGKRGKGKAVSSGRGPCHQVVMTME